MQKTKKKHKKEQQKSKTTTANTGPGKMYLLPKI